MYLCPLQTQKRAYFKDSMMGGTMYVCMCVCMCVYMYVCMYVCLYECMYALFLYLGTFELSQKCWWGHTDLRGFLVPNTPQM